ncbi:MAG: type II secretion system protein [Tepidisphaeraceae bacterium]
MSSQSQIANRKSKVRAFTLFELLIATAVIGLILASVVPFIMATREANRRVACAANLAVLRDALNAYVKDHKSYPRVRYDAAVRPEGYVAFTGADDANPFAADSKVEPSDVSAALWLLVRGDYVKDTSVFICPSSNDSADRLYDGKGAAVTAKQRGNFRSGHNLSYSVFCMYGSAVKDFWSDTLQSGCALMADKNPGIGDGDDVTKVATSQPAEAYAITNSRNHGRGIQNVLYADGSVQQERTPYVGVGYNRSAAGFKNGDNIYTALSAKPLPAGTEPPADGQGVAGKNVSPAWPYDSYLVPTAQD